MWGKEKEGKEGRRVREGETERKAGSGSWVGAPTPANKPAQVRHQAQKKNTNMLLTQ